MIDSLQRDLDLMVIDLKEVVRLDLEDKDETLQELEEDLMQTVEDKTLTKKFHYTKLIPSRGGFF